MKGSRVLPNHKDVSPRQGKQKGSQLRDIAKSKDGHLQDKATDSVTEKPSKLAARNAQKTSLKQSDRPKGARRPKGVAEAAQSRPRKDKTGTVTIKDIETRSAGVISQSELALLMESLKKGDRSVLNAMAAQATKDTNFAVTENRQPKTPASTQPNSEKIKQLQNGTRDTDIRTEAASVPGILSSNSRHYNLLVVGRKI